MKRWISIMCLVLFCVIVIYIKLSNYRESYGCGALHVLMAHL